MYKYINPVTLGAALDEHAIVSITDAAGNIIYANQKFVDISGFTMPELLGKNHRIIKSGVHPSTFYKQMWDTLLSGKTWQGEVCNRRKNGELYWVRASIFSILDENGLLQRFISIRTDITETKMAEARLQATNTELESYRQDSEYEMDIARNLMEHMIKKSSAEVKDIEIWIKAATKISGDLLITQNYKNERSYILLADAMGHGLPAALPLIPIEQVFAAMAQEGFTVSAIVREMNAKTNGLIQQGNFVAVTMLSIDYANRLVEIWNGGNPPALLFNRTGEIIRKLASSHLALGILKDDAFDSATELFRWENNCWLTVYSDGLIDAQDVHDVSFGEVGIIDTLLGGNNPHLSLKNAVLTHLGERDAHDDISIATISLYR